MDARCSSDGLLAGVGQLCRSFRVAFASALQNLQPRGLLLPGLELDCRRGRGGLRGGVDVRLERAGGVPGFADTHSEHGSRR